ncbi:MAG TPA: alpha/beta hydrolase, partial [Planctomycetes bacterium]|nr:alpha/beta hydrolase [Planctomycetota bacterium]
MLLWGSGKNSLSWSLTEVHWQLSTNDVARPRESLFFHQRRFTLTCTSYGDRFSFTVPLSLVSACNYSHGDSTNPACIGGNPSFLRPEWITFRESIPLYWNAAQETHSPNSRITSTPIPEIDCPAGSDVWRITMNKRLKRREMLGGTLAAATALALSPNLPAFEVKTKVTTYTYKRVGDLEIKADVHRADDNLARPVVVWIHGGALINGNRAGVSGRVKKRMLEAGYVIVSIDYRLAPETKLPGIIEDVEDAFKWIRKDGAALFHADTGRIAVMGGSAGGCLTLTSGFRVQPRPTVLVSFWGYGDLIGDWYSKPSPHPRHNRVQITKDDAFA